MQPIRQLMQGLERQASTVYTLHAPEDLRGLVPDISEAAFKTLLSRAVQQNYLERVCRGIYLYKKGAPTGLVLFHAAARLRANDFNYISLETALSDAGVISQMLLNWVTIMSSGRSNVIDCGRWGRIEFVHTNQRPEDLSEQLIYDDQCRLWRAKVPLALRDMRVTHRDLGLIDWSVVDEFVR